MKKLILLEYFTSQSSILKSRDKEIFREALNLSDSIIRNFIMEKKEVFLCYVKTVNQK